MGVIPRAVAGLALAAAGGVAYAWGYERKAFRLREVELPVLPPGSPTLRVLHLSDLHITPGQPWKVDWVSGLARSRPDFVVNTGDNLAAVRGVPEALKAMGPLLDVPGAFVPGSNDWFAPVAKNP